MHRNAVPVNASRALTGRCRCAGPAALLTPASTSRRRMTVFPRRSPRHCVALRCVALRNSVLSLSLSHAFDDHARFSTPRVFEASICGQLDEGEIKLRARKRARNVDCCRRGGGGAGRNEGGRRRSEGIEELRMRNSSKLAGRLQTRYCIFDGNLDDEISLRGREPLSISRLGARCYYLFLTVGIMEGKIDGREKYSASPPRVKLAQRRAVSTR